MKTPPTSPVDQANQSVAAAIPRANTDPTRPSYHFLPPALWMNDPNGPIFHNGWFHLFYQHNPYGDDWGHMHWGHTRSRDLVHWEHLPIALWPSLDQGEEHVFSGCAWKDGTGQPMLFYTSVKVGERDNRPVNEQWAARPLDVDLLTWEKHRANPILALHHSGAPAFNGPWRDPFIFQEAGRTFLVVGGDFENSTGVGLYEAQGDSLLHWHYHGLLVETSKNYLQFYECPNFVKIGNKWILLTSPCKPTAKPIEYMVGNFDLKTLKFTVEQEGVLDAGFSDLPNFYASNIVFDEQGHCILLGWLRGFAKERGWNGALALPRILTIGDDGHPRQQPLPKLHQLRGMVLDLGPQQVYDYGELDQSFGVPALEIEAKFRLGAAGDVGISINGKRLLRYEAAANGGKLTIVDTEVVLGSDGDGYLDFQIFLDRSTLEVFANGGKVVVTRIIDTPTDCCALKFYSLGASCEVLSLKVWELKSIWE